MSVLRFNEVEQCGLIFNARRGSFFFRAKGKVLLHNIFLNEEHIEKNFPGRDTRLLKLIKVGEAEGRDKIDLNI